MKKIDYKWLGSVTPFAWAGAVVFFLVAESLILVAEKHSLSGLSTIRRWSLPIVFTAPLVVGYNFAGTIRKFSDNPDIDEIATVASASIAILVLLAYALLTGTLTVFL
jgi:hypothetical protein